MHYQCQMCESTADWDTFEFRCSCGGLWGVVDESLLDWEAIATDCASMLRYQHCLSKYFREAWSTISLGEGWTATIPVDTRLSTDSTLPTNRRHGWIKMDQLMPTGSFKDRGAAILVALAKSAGATRVVQDSSGNAGHSVATYAARAGLGCDIFVPRATKTKKIEMMRGLGATVHVIDGTREAAADAALNEVSSGTRFYASHVYHPAFYEGTSTFLFEVKEQFATLPSQVVLPLGNGTLVLGVARAAQRMKAAGIISETPRMIAVQAEHCAPIEVAFRLGKSEVAPVEPKETVADGIAIARPARGRQVMEQVRQSGGEVVSVTESQITTTWQRLFSAGLHVEPTTAATLAVALELGGDWIAPLCAAGFKS